VQVFCHVTGITSDFLSFIVVEHIWFFHGALQFFSVGFPYIYEFSYEFHHRFSNFIHVEAYDGYSFVAAIVTGTYVLDQCKKTSMKH